MSAHGRTGAGTRGRRAGRRRRLGGGLAALLLGGLSLTSSAGPASADEPAPAPAGAACLDRAVGAIQHRYESVRDFAGSFAQTTRPVHLGVAEPEPSRSSGRVVVAKPARMRWEYEQPEPSLVVSDGETLWIYDPAFQEAQRLPVGEGFLSGAAIQFLLGEGDIRKSFRVSLVDCAADAVELELVPREPASYEKLRVVAGPSGDLLSTEVHDLLGNVTRVAFSDVVVNRDPPPATFRFTPPEGVSVIDLRAPEAR